MTLSTGTRLGPYEILAPLGAGGMGEVYRARDTRLGREVALKVLPQELFEDKEIVARFEREAKLLAALNHPGIATIYSFEGISGRHVLAMELIEGETLDEKICSGPLPLEESLSLSRQIAQALEAAHEKGIVHRDLKPANIKVSPRGQIKLLDFGLAKIFEGDSSKGGDDELTHSPTLTARATQPGVILGTTPYMSPEQVRGFPVDHRSDIFSFGAILYEMLSGKKAFKRNTAADTMSAILTEEPPELSESGRQILPALDQIVRHCLEKRPEERFQSARDLAFTLRAAREVAAAPKSLSGRQRPTIDSIAILPFANATEDPEAEYLSDGITDTIISQLSRLPSLRVMARSTVFRYKGSDVDAIAAGRELKVGAVVTGRVFHRGDDLVIRAELVDLADGSQLWGGRHERKITDVLSIENEIAGQISESLRLKLTGEEKQQLARRPTANPEAYRLYLRGRYFWNKRTEEGLRRGIEYFRQAIETDPDYAVAYVGVAHSYAVLGFHAIAPPGEAFPRAKAAALKALELDSSLAEARAPLAYTLHYYDWNWSEAEKEYRRCLESAPNDATAHNYYASLLTSLGRFEEALNEWRRAQELDPLSLINRAATGWFFYVTRRYDDAIREAQKTLEMDPTFVVARRVLGLAYGKSSRPAQAIEQFEKAVESSGGSTQYLADLGHALATAGREADARRVLGELEEVSRSRYVSPYFVAPVHVALGDMDQAFACLDRAYAERSHGLTFLRVDPNLDDLRRDPRFADHVRRVGLP
jgi:serine/threonine protein kinase/tetratricopeptide (TPR) repeat protein